MAKRMGTIAHAEKLLRHGAKITACKGITLSQAHCIARTSNADNTRDEASSRAMPLAQGVEACNCSYLLLHFPFILPLRAVRMECSCRA